MTRAAGRIQRAAVALGLVTLVHLCRADTGIAASADPYAQLNQAGPLNFVSESRANLWGYTDQYDFYVSAQCFNPQANPQNFPAGPLITYNPGNYIYNDYELLGQLVFVGSTTTTFTADQPTASATRSPDNMQVVFTFDNYPEQDCVPNLNMPGGVACSVVESKGTTIVLDCTGPTVNCYATCPSNQVPSTISPWGNGCGCSGGNSCIVDYSDPNSSCNCSGGGGGGGGDCASNDGDTCSTDSCGNACGSTQCDGTCDSSNCSSCYCDMGSSCSSNDCSVYDCAGTCNSSSCTPADDDCGGCPDGEVCSSYDFPFPICQVMDPILIDLSGNGFSMTDQKGGVKFDFYGSGKPRRIAWTAAGVQNGWLALDLNHNGQIDNGEELFSNVTVQPGQSAQHLGFKALAQYDDPKLGGNGDGIIDAKDAIYSRLLIWVDKNHNGVTDPGELMTLKSAGIKSIAVNYEDAHYADLYGNQFRYRAKVVWTEASKNARQGWAYDVVLVTPPASGGR